MIREYDAERRALTKAKGILEQHLGRPLLSKEYVYQKDGDPFNLELSNLELIVPEDPRSIYYGEDVKKASLGSEIYP